MALLVPDTSILESYLEYRQNITALKRWLVRTILLLQTDVTGDQIQGISSSLFIFDQNLDRVTATVNLVSFIRTIESHPDTYDVRAEYVATAALIDNAVAIVKGVNTQALLTGLWGADGRPIYQTFTPTQSASFTTSLQAILDSMS